MDIVTDAWWGFAAAAAPGVIGLVVAIVLAVKLKRVRRAQRVVLGDASTADLVAAHAGLQRDVDGTRTDLAAVHERLTHVSGQLEDLLATTTRFHGIVRYDAYRDMGGRQSWSVASIDRQSSGTILTALHGREDTRLFVKELSAGVPDRELSPEETRALAVAQERWA